MTRKARAATAIAILILFASCVSTPVLLRSEERSSLEEKPRRSDPVVEIRADELFLGSRGTHPGSNTFALESPLTPGITISGIFERKHPDRIDLYVTEAHLFTNWSNGWTDGAYEASGTIHLRRTRDRGWRVEVTDTIELWSIQSGEIRYYDTYFRGEEGRSRVQARVDRLQAIAGWLSADPAEPLTAEIARDLATAQALATGTEPADGRESPAIDETAWVTSLVESGTLERDLRESASLLAALWNLDYLQDTVLPDLILKEG